MLKARLKVYPGPPIVANHPGMPWTSRDLTDFESLSRDPGITLFCPGISCFSGIDTVTTTLPYNCDIGHELTC